MVLRAGLPKCLSHELGTLAPDLQIDVQGAPRSNATSQRALERRCILLHGPIPSWAVPPVIQSVRTVGGARKAADFLRRCTARMQDSVMNEVHAQTQARHAHALNRGTSFARAQLPYRQQHALCKALRPQVQQSRVALKFVVLRCINATGDTLKGQRLHVSRQIFATDLSSGEAWRMCGDAETLQDAWPPLEQRLSESHHDGVSCGAAIRNMRWCQGAPHRQTASMGPDSVQRESVEPAKHHRVAREG